MSASLGITGKGINHIPPQDNTPQQAAPTPTPNGAREGDKKKGQKAEASNTPSSKVPPPYALCEVVGNPTNRFLDLDELKALIHAPKAPINPPALLEKRAHPHVIRRCAPTMHAPYVWNMIITLIISLKSLDIEMC